MAHTRLRLVRMGKKKAAKGKRATAPKSRPVPVMSEADRESLDGLRDALDLTLTRVIEDDMGIEEAQAVLRYLQKELDGFEKRARRTTAPARRGPRRAKSVRKTRRTRES